MSDRSRFLLTVFAVTLACLLVGAFDSWVRSRSAQAPTKSVIDPATDPRFRRVIYRQDELLDVPVLAEAFRIAKARCLIGDCTQPEHQAYQALFGDGFFVLERPGSFTVVFGQVRLLPPGERSWTTPRIISTVAFGWSPSRTFDESFREVEYRTPALVMSFAKVDGRLALTDFSPDTGKGTGSLSFEGDFVSLDYYPMQGINISYRAIDEKSVAERMANARRVLEQVRQDAIAQGPKAPQLKTRTILEWIPTDHPCGCTGQTWVDGNGARRIDISINALMDFSDNRLRWLFGHELGHIARCMQSDVTCQDAAEAHALKLMGPDLYRRAMVIATHESEESVSKRIEKLDAVNKQYPGK